MNRVRLLTGLTVAALLGSALGIVYTQHVSRTLVLDLQRQSESRDRLNVQWGRLLLEHGTWATHGRVERLAREQLGMHTPALPEVQMVVK